MTTQQSEARKTPASTSAQPLKPCPPSLNKIPACCEYYESCDDEEGWQDVEEEERRPKKPCKMVLKKRVKPCVRRSQLNLPGQVPDQFGGKPPCRKIPKPCHKKKRCKPKQGDQHCVCLDEEKNQACENQDEECPCDHDGEGGEGQGGDGGDDDNTGDDTGNIHDQKPCRKKKKKPKPPKSPCRPPPTAGGPLPKDERIFPSLPRRNLGEKPPEQKFPPAEDPDSYDKRRRAPCGTNKNKQKPCRKHGSDSSSCSSSSSSTSIPSN